MSKLRPDGMTCKNCVFWDVAFFDHRSYDADAEAEERKISKRARCCRYPPQAEIDHRVTLALTQIHWVVSKGHTDYADTASAHEFDPEYADTRPDHPLTDEEDWCGEFKADW